MRRTGIKRRTPLRRSASLSRKTPLSPRNVGRRARAFAEAFGERGAAVRAMPCLCLDLLPYDRCSGPIEAAHVRSRGAGGTRRDLVPLCQRHHRAQHSEGIKSFANGFGLDLQAEAQRIAVELDRQGYP